MGMAEAGYSQATRYSFNKAVATLSRRIEVKSQETVERLVTAPPQPPKGMTRTQVPKYKMLDLLYDRPAEVDPRDDDRGEKPPLPELDFLPTANL